jgi:hypothetical protein
MAKLLGIDFIHDKRLVDKKYMFSDSGGEKLNIINDFK